MFRKALALLLALMLTTGVLTAGICENENCFVPYLVADAFNRGLAFSVTKFYESDEDRQSQALDDYSVHYTEAQGDYVYYNSRDWAVEISGYFEGTKPDIDAPAHSITFSIPSSFDETIKALMQMSLSIAILAIDEKAELSEIQSLVDLAYEGWTEGPQTLDRNGYQLTAFSHEGRNYFAILQSES